MFLLDASNELVLKNSARLRRAAELYIWQAYLQDLDGGDITSKYFIKDKEVSAEIAANGSGILSGIEEAKWFLGRLGIKVSGAMKDGSGIRKGEVVMKISGNAKKILSAERTLLNLLQRMSGVATKTKLMSDKLPKGIKLLATRKTLCGLLDKKAVSAGGGCTHRLNLNDAVLIKDNHLSLSENRTRDFRKILRQAKNVRFVEIELQSAKDVEWLLKNFPNPKNLNPHVSAVAMLDNLSPSHIKKFAPLLKKSGYIVEVSGGINEKNITSFCLPGVSAISSGGITMKVENLDMSLNINKRTQDSEHRSQLIPC